MFRFERLDVWKKSVDYAALVYEATDRFPTAEKFGLVSQTTRAAVSVSANIAEGSSRASDKDFSRFVEIAFGSLCESVSHLHIAKRRSLISTNDYDHIYAAAQELSKMLSKFRTALGEWKSVE